MKSLVSWEVLTGNSKASLGRLMEALVDLGGELRSHYVMSARGLPRSHGTLMAMIRLDAADVERFKEIAKPESISYRSPTWFNNGSIISRFKTPEEEIEELKAEQRLRDVGIPEFSFELLVGFDASNWQEPTAIARALRRNGQNKLEQVCEARQSSAPGEDAVRAARSVAAEVSLAAIDKVSVDARRRGRG